MLVIVLYIGLKNDAIAFKKTILVKQASFLFELPETGRDACFTSSKVLS
jgi:hypothetical protein